MMRWKWILGIAAVLVFILVVTAYVILISYDYNKLKPRITQAVEDATGRELTLGGDLELDIGLSPALVVSDVTFANAPWGSQPQMVKAERLQAQIHLLPLLFEDVKFDRIGLTNVEVLLETDATGKGNWEFKPGDKSKKSSWTLKELQIENVRIAELKFSFRDGKSGSTSRFVLDSLDASRKPSSDKLSVDLKGTSNGRPVALSGQTGLIRNLLAHKPLEVDLSGKVSGAKIKIDGAIGDVLNLGGIDLKVQAAGTDLKELADAAGVTLLETNGFTVAGHLKGSAEALALEDAAGSVSRGSVELTIKGNVGDLISLSGIDLKLKGSGKDLAELGPVVETTLPKTGPYTVSGRLTGSSKALSLQDAQGSISRDSLRLAVNGKVKDLLALSGIDLEFKGSGKDLAELGPVVDKKLPQTGSYTVSGRLTGSSKAPTLQDARGSVSGDKLSLAVTGKVKDLLAPSGIDLEFKGSGNDLAELGPMVETTLPKTGPYTVSGRLTGSSKALSLQDAQGNVSRDSLRLAVNGKVKDLLAPSGINLKLEGSGKELAEIGPLIGTKLPEFGSFNVGGNLTGSTKALALDGLTVIVGKSDFKGSAKVEFRKRPKLSLALESGLVDFTPLIGEAKKDEKELTKKGGSAQRLFPDDPLPFQILKKVDADIVLKAKGIQARKAKFDLGHLTLTLEASELAVDKLEALYKGTKISGNIHIYPGSPPDVATKFLVQDFDLGSYLREIGALDKAEGHVDIAADLKSRGDSAHALAANLDGTIGLVMGQGYLSKWLDLISRDLSKEVIPFWGKHQKEGGHINCAVIEWDIKSGLATSQAFVFDTKIAILRAKGDINLDTEKVNFLLSPQPKDLSLTTLNTKLRVSGTLLHPKVRPDYTALAKKGARALSSLVLGPFGLLAPFVSLGAHDKHPCDIEKITGKSEK